MNNRLAQNNHSSQTKPGKLSRERILFIAADPNKRNRQQRRALRVLLGNGKDR